MKINYFKGLTVLLLLLLSFSSVKSQELAIRNQGVEPATTMQQETICVNIDSTIVKKRTIKDVFLLERAYYQRTRRQTHKFYNPVTYFYRLFGI